MTIETTLTIPPDAPSRSDPDNFRVKADDWVAWQENSLVPEMNDIIDEINDTLDTTTAYIDNALASVDELTDLAQQAKDYVTSVSGAVSWVSGTTYNTGDGCIGSNGYTYTSLIDSNTGNDPVTDDGTKWKRISGPFPGGVEEQESATDITLTATGARIQSIAMSEAGKYVEFPDARTLITGPEFILKNTGTEDFYAIDGAGNSIGIVPAGSTVTCYLFDTSTEAGTWEISATGVEDKVLEGGLVAFTSAAIDTDVGSMASVKLDDTVIIVTYHAASNDRLYVVAISADDGSVLDGPDEVTTDRVKCLSGCIIGSNAVFFCGHDQDYPGLEQVIGFVVTYSGGVLTIAESPIAIGPSSYTAAPAYVDCCRAGSTDSAVIVFCYGNSSVPTVAAAQVGWDGADLTVDVSATNIYSTSVSYGYVTVESISSTAFIFTCATSTQYEVKFVTFEYTTGFATVASVTATSDSSTGNQHFVHIEKLQEDATYEWFSFIYLSSASYANIKAKVFRITKSTLAITAVTGAATGNIVEDNAYSVPGASTYYSSSLGLIVMAISTGIYPNQTIKIVLLSWDSTNFLYIKIEEYEITSHSGLYYSLHELGSEDGVLLFSDTSNSSYGVSQKFKVIP